MHMMGDEEFDTFYSVSYSRLAGQLYAMTGDWAEARQVVLEAFVRAWDHRSGFDLEAAPDSWVRTVAWHLAGSRRRRGHEQSSGLAGQEPVRFVEALRRLREDQRHFVVLHYLCDLGVGEIAAETGVTIEAVRAALARGRAALAAARDGELLHEELVGELYDFANRNAHPRLTAQRVREQADRRRLSRRSVAAGGVGVLALAGVVVVALLAGSPAPASVAPTAGHPTGAHRVAAKQSRS
jgi:RNA polymerase sigma-70 factor (ECF subfamily)